MSYEFSPGKFMLFRADKGDNENRPDYKGNGKDLQGNEIEVAGWIKQGKAGKFMSCTIKFKGQPQAQAQPKRTPPPDDGGMAIDDDIPW